MTDYYTHAIITPSEVGDMDQCLKRIKAECEKAKFQKSPIEEHDDVHVMLPVGYNKAFLITSIIIDRVDQKSFENGIKTYQQMINEMEA